MSNLPANVDPQTGEITETGQLPAGFGEASGVNTSLAVMLARADVDQQIATARALPRTVQRAVNNILTLATLDEETAEECVYALPRGNKPIKGPSIRLAEIIAQQWGNNRVAARVVHVDRFEKYVEAEGVFHDLETNAVSSARVRRRIVDSKGRLYNDDMIVVTGNAACAIARRNAILAGVPKGVWSKAYRAVEGVIAGDIKTLAERRDKAMKAFAAFGVKPEQIFAVLDIKGLDDINLDHLSTLIAMHSALKSGEATVEEMFKQAKPAAEEQSGKPTTLAGKLDDVAAKTSGKGQDGEQAADAGKDAAKDPTPSTASGAQQDAGAKDKGPEDFPTAEDIEAAESAGSEAFRAGRAKKAVPDRFKGSKPLAEAWQRGWQTSKDEAPE